MDSLRKVFFSGQIYKIIQKGKYIDVRVGSRLLTAELNKKPHSLLTPYLISPKNEEKYLRTLCVVGLALLYSDECYEAILEHLTEIQFVDSWISKQILSPFARWAKKCSETPVLFKQIKINKLEASTLMDRLPYAIKLLQELVSINNSIPKFGRYYNLKEAHQDYTMISEILMALNNKIYIHLKNSLEHFLNTETVERIEHHKEVIQWMFHEVFPKMNEEIKAVTLSKHFTFYQKGIVVKLIDPAHYSCKVQGILNIKPKSKRSLSTEYESLKSQIFPEDGSFDERLFLSTFEDSSKLNSKARIRRLLTQGSQIETKIRLVHLKNRNSYLS